MLNDCTHWQCGNSLEFHSNHPQPFECVKSYPYCVSEDPSAVTSHKKN